MFSREMRDGKFIGYSARAHGAEFFFGSKNLSRDELKTYFPDLEFAFLKQVHGRGVVEADPRQTLEADAHFTSRKNLALVSQTADCVPVLLASAGGICAIHSGWRSSALNIVSAAKEAAGEFDFAAIGPHILMPSFEVGTDVAEKLLQAAPAGTQANQLIYPHSDPAKAYFDLTELIRLQLRAAFGDRLILMEALEDTKTSVQFASFRRDKDQAGRQFSFVVMK
jgi:YfiH family protein